MEKVKVNEEVNVTEEVKAVVAAVEEEVSFIGAEDVIDTGLKVLRSEFTLKAKDKSDKVCYSYYIDADIRGKSVKINLVPAMKKDSKDTGAYVFLDIVFMKDETANLGLKPYSMTDAEGEIKEGYSYVVSNYDEEEGINYSYKVKPEKQSDSAFLDVLMKRFWKARKALESSK